MVRRICALSGGDQASRRDNVAEEPCRWDVEFFESTEPPHHHKASTRYYQAHESPPGATDVQRFIQETSEVGQQGWERRLSIARQFVTAVEQLHAREIVHCDLKPENILLLPDSSIITGYRLKLIDLDFSLPVDQRAPWHGEQGCVSTPGWASPEHVRHDVPRPASDIFTCGLILYELLSYVIPYKDLDFDAYMDQVLRHSAQPPILLGEHGNGADIARLIHAALSPDSFRRPSAGELREALG